MIKISSTMFHKVTILLNSTVLSIFAINYYYCHIFNNVHINVQKLLYFIILGVLFLIFSFLLQFITSLITNVKVGKPPLNALVIAYKYGLSDTITSSSIFEDRRKFPEKDIVQICYENRHGPFGIAHGVVIQDNTVQSTDQKGKVMDLHGYHLFHTREVTHALYVSCPTLPWLSYFGVWLVLRIVYPKLYKYSKHHKLSAYPVVELYKRFSVVLMAPLSQQDYFVVPEAEAHLHRSSSCLDTTMSTLSNVSPSTLPSKSLSMSPFTCPEQTSIRTSTPKLRNGHAKQA